MKRYFILILAAVLILSCLAGCRRKDNTVSTNPNGMIGDTTEKMPSTARPSTEDTQRPSNEGTQRPSTESSTRPSTQDDTQDSTDGSEAPTGSGGESTDATGDDVVGRARRTRPLFR